MNKNKKLGAAAVTALAVMILLLTVSIGVAGLSMNSMRRSNRDTGAWLALQAARAGLEQQIALCNQEVRATKGVLKASKSNLSADVANIAEGVVLTTEVAPLTDPKFAYVTATATVYGQTKSVRARVQSSYYNIWDNVIFAGGGSSGSVKGNTTMKGSVHILGEGEPFSDLNGNGARDIAEKFTDKNLNGVWDPGEAFIDTNKDGVCNISEPFRDLNGDKIYNAPLEQVEPANDIGGNAGVGNNYAGMDSTLRAEIVDPPKTSTGLETLNANFRVRRGAVNMTGSASVGAASTESGGKGPMDGTYVSDGFVGSGAKNVYSDNGKNKPYDMEAMNLSYPFISGLGSQTYYAPDGTSWTTHEDYLNATAMTVSVLKIDSTQAGFSYTSGANSISFVPAKKKGDANILTVNGIVKIDGNVSIGAKDVINYQGRGTIFATGSIYIDGNLHPVAGMKFPIDTALGFIAKNNLCIATATGSSQLTLSGAFYAQAKVVSAKQNSIAGTFVASVYEMSQVPKIYQVPDLVKYMPPSMPGDGTQARVSVQSWRLR